MSKRMKALARSVWVKVRGLFARGTPGFGILITILLFLLFTLITALTHLYLLTLIAPVLAGLVTGFYTKGLIIIRGKTAFIGVFAGTLILLLLSSLSIYTLMPELVASIWAELPTIAIALAFSPIVCGVLGFVGGLLSGGVAKLIQHRKPSKPKD